MNNQNKSVLKSEGESPVHNQIERSLASRCSSAAKVPAEFCGKVVARVLELKDRLLKQYELALPGYALLVRAALDEAEELAWETGVPHLLLPDFAELRLAQLAPAYALAYTPATRLSVLAEAA